jgi:putative transposase
MHGVSLDLGERQADAVTPNVIDRGYEAPAPNRNWIADFTCVWTAEVWLYVAPVVDLSRVARSAGR